MVKTTVFWVERHHLISYVKEDHSLLVWKFLFWAKGEEGQPVIVAGGNEGHDELAIIAKGGSLSRAVYAKGRPDGAGRCSVNQRPGWVYEWHSSTLEVFTPAEFRPIILEALGLKE